MFYGRRIETLSGELAAVKNELAALKLKPTWPNRNKHFGVCSARMTA
jgi:hypothetical protein